MKYCKTQFGHLVEGIKVLSNHVDVVRMDPSILHFWVYQEFNPSGHDHNKLILEGNVLRRKHKQSSNNYRYILPISKEQEESINFQLYPNETNDNNIRVAVRRAVKLATK